MAKGKYLRKPKVSSGKKIGRVLLVIVLIIVLLLGAVAAFVWSKLGKITYDDGKLPVETSAPTFATEVVDPLSGVDDPSMAATELPNETGTGIIPEEIIDTGDLTAETAPSYSQGELFKDKDVMNILLVGSDEYTHGYASTSRCDLNIIISINKAEKTVKLVSLSRGIALKMLDGPYVGKYEWLTNVHRWAGHDAVLEALSDAFKIELDRYVRVNFQTVIKIVDAIGGIEMEMTAAEARAMNINRSDKCVEGMNTLSGLRAVDFARLRSVDDDWGRVQRQRKCILAVIDKLKGSSFSELNDLCDMVLPMIKTNLTKLEIAELIIYSPTFLDSEFGQLTIPVANSYGGMTVHSGAGGWALDYEKNNAILHEFLYGAESEG